MIATLAPVQVKSPATPAQPGAAAILQRKPVLAGGDRDCACGENPDQDEENRGMLQRKASGEGSGGSIPQSVYDVLNSSGQPLDEAVRAFMEPRFGHDFSQVRIHTGDQAAESAAAVNALAYTVGRDIVFGQGQYAPHTHEGQRLIAHELSHTLQQGGFMPPMRNTPGRTPGAQQGRSVPAMQKAGLPAAFPRLEIGSPTSPSEGEADAIAGRVMAAGAESAAGFAATAPAGTLQRKISPSLPRIKYLMRSRGFFEKNISEADAHEALGLLKGLSDADLADTVKALEVEDKEYIERLLMNVSKVDKQNEYDALRRIKNARYWKIESKTTDPATKTTTTVTTEVTGSCSPDQANQVLQAAMTGLSWLDAAVAQLDAYLKSPGDKNNAAAGNALDLHFHDKTADVARHVRGRLDHIRQDLRAMKTLQIECHGTWDLGCVDASAYALPEMIVFCWKFFGKDAVWQAEAVVHEAAHSQVGGPHITDRAYQSDRLLTRLSSAEALTNAESYGLLTQQLGTGRVPAFTAPQDTAEDCPDDWWKLLQAAIAQAQRWNRNLQVTLDELSPASLKPPSTWGKLLGGQTQGDIDRAKKSVDKLASKLESPIDFECEPKGGGRCDDSMTYWYAVGDFHICPSWRNQKVEADRVESLLAGLYGYAGDVGDGTRMSNYARLARENNASWKSPASLGDVLGSSKWTTDEISISLSVKTPDLPKKVFWETGSQHEKPSDALKIYQHTPGQPEHLSFRCDIGFAVDSYGQGRPTPFTPPILSAVFEFIAPAGAFKFSHDDPRPIYDSAGSDLQTKIPTKERSFGFDNDGSFHIHLHLFDPDTKIPRDMDDTIPVKTP